MKALTVSPKYQIAIPKELRESMGILPGEKLNVMRYGDRIELIPVKSIKKMRGFLKGIDTTVEREKDRV